MIAIGLPRFVANIPDINILYCTILWLQRRHWILYEINVVRLTREFYGYIRALDCFTISHRARFLRETYTQDQTDPTIVTLLKIIRFSFDKVYKILIFLLRKAEIPRVLRALSTLPKVKTLSKILIFNIFSL